MYSFDFYRQITSKQPQNGLKIEGSIILLFSNHRGAGPKNDIWCVQSADTLQKMLSASSPQRENRFPLLALLGKIGFPIRENPFP